MNAGQELAKKRWAKTTKAERKAYSDMMIDVREKRRICEHKWKKCSLCNKIKL